MTLHSDAELDRVGSFSDDADITSDEPALDEIPKEQRNLRTQAYDKSVSDVIRMIQEGDIRLDPDYQRSYLWDNKKASALVESILLNVPIPVIYVAEDDDGAWNVVDGLQRLNSLNRFFLDELKLRGLEVLQDLNGLQYSQIEAKSGRTLRNGILRFILIFKESHPDIKYDIFIRLNRGSVALSDQELRNCLYRGSLNILLHDLKRNSNFMSMMGLSVESHRRMADAEMILRYFAISDSYDTSTESLPRNFGKITSSLNRYYAKNRDASGSEIERLREKFIKTVQKVHDVFGDKAFKRINEDGTTDTNISRSVMDLQMVIFEQYPLADLADHKQQIFELLRVLPLQDAAFSYAITSATSDRKQLLYRLSTWQRELSKLLK